MTIAGLQPPLLTGWTEHIGPQGQMYWYNAALQQSTYSRPTAQPAGFGSAQASILVYTGPPPPSSSSANPSSSQASAPMSDGIQSKAKKEKEKPAKKEPIVGAEGWLRVTTTLGNIFYTHKESKRSEWTIPDEIREQVEALQDEERRFKALEEEEARLAKEQQKEEQRKTREEERQRRIKEEEEARRKRQEELRLREEAVKKQKEERERIQEERRKILLEQSKRKRDEEENGEGGAENEGTKEVDKKARIGSESDDEEAWQRQMAADMAAEVEKQAETTPIANNIEVSKATLSLEENKTLFMHMLSKLNGTPSEVNPMAPWDRELPKFIHERDYTVLSSLRDRQDAFNEWCKLRLREKRNKAKEVTPIQSIALSGKEVKTESSNNHDQNGKEDVSKMYRQLLEIEVTSTRTKWEDFKRAWRKDRRFFAFGRDDREREKSFRQWLKELGEQKRRVAEEAENNFAALLEEKLDETSRLKPDATLEEAQSLWTQSKRTSGLDKDPRYEGVGSSSRRAEIFAQWAKGQRRRERELEEVSNETELDDKNKVTSEDGVDRALRQREEIVRSKRAIVESQKRRAFGQATREESITTFQQLLVDAIRDPLMSVSEAMHILSSDSRFDAPGIGSAEKGQLVEEHINELNQKRLRDLQTIFEKYAPTLDVEAEVAIPLIKDDDEIQRRHLDDLRVLRSGRVKIKDLFDDWRKGKEEEAKIAFYQMLKENAFVQFWGGLRQEHQQSQKQATNGDDKVTSSRLGEDEEDDDEPDLLQMAGNVDLEEIHSILRNDQRYRAFQHQHKRREEWIRNYLQTMSVPKKTIFQRDT